MRYLFIIIVFTIHLGYAAQYIQISMNGNTVNIGNHISEITLYKGSTKLAHSNISVTSSTNSLNAHSGQGPTALFNGVGENGSTDITTLAHPGNNSQTFVLTLNSNHDFDRLWIAGYNGGGRTYQNVTIGISNDGVAYANQTHQYPGNGAFFESFQGVIGISMSPSTDTIHAGDTLNLQASLEKLGSVDSAINWSSSNTDIAVVTAEGAVIAVAEGNVEIRASSSYNSILSVDKTLHVIPSNSTHITNLYSNYNTTFHLFNVHGKNILSHTGNTSTWKNVLKTHKLSGLYILKENKNTQKIFLNRIEN